MLLVGARTIDGLELVARDTSPAKLSELLGRACCTVCIPKNSDNCGCCGGVCLTYLKVPHITDFGILVLLVS